MRPRPARTTLRPKGNMRRIEGSNGRSGASSCGVPPGRSSTTASARASSPAKRRCGARGIRDLPELTLDVGAIEVLERAARRRAALILVTRSVLCAAVGVIGGAGQTDEAELTDLHPGPQLDRQGRDIREFEGHVTAEPGIDEAGGGVREEAEPAQG